MSKSGFWVSLSAVAALGLAASSAIAHHAFSAEFDSDKPIDLSGTVTKLKWVNPHAWLYFDVKGKDGTTTNWGVEFGTPNALGRKGLKREDFAPGTPVHIKGYRSKNGGPFGYSVSVTLVDGRTITTGGAQDDPTGVGGAGGGGAGGP